MKLQTNDRVYSSKTGFNEGEAQFHRLLQLENLDRKIEADPSLANEFENELSFALNDAYNNLGDSRESHLFLQRVLYRINRLKLFWYDDLENYANEDSVYVFSIRKQIESAWQSWEESELDAESLTPTTVRKALKDRTEGDLNPAPSESDLYLRDRMNEAGYRRVMAIASLNGLVEASQLSRVQGGVGNEAQSMLTRIFLEEYGGGRLSRKHSTFFAVMLEALDMDAAPEVYFDLVPWEVLANINLSFALSEHKRNFLRYVGGLLYFETSAPASFGILKQAGERLGLGADAVGYWDLHIKEDERHGRWMLDDVAAPLIEMYPEDAWKIVFGYDEQKYFNARASRAVVRSVQEAENPN